MEGFSQMRTICLSLLQGHF